MASINVPSNRKLQLSYSDMSFEPTNALQNASAASSPPQQQPPPPPPSQLITNPSLFDSSMALTVLVLLTALFFMGFFSIYLRRFSANQTTATTTSPHAFALTSYTRRNYPNAAAGGQRLPTVATASRKGVSPEVIKSLPVYDYYDGDAKFQVECPICLGEFEERECVKMIPYCKHVFHLDCIDTWLKMHVTCPVCRGTQFFEVLVGGGSGGGCSGRSTAENSDNRGVEAGTPRSSSCRCSVFGERI